MIFGLRGSIYVGSPMMIVGLRSTRQWAWARWAAHFSLRICLIGRMRWVLIFDRLLSLIGPYRSSYGPQSLYYECPNEVACWLLAIDWKSNLKSEAPTADWCSFGGVLSHSDLEFEMNSTKTLNFESQLMSAVCAGSPLDRQPCALPLKSFAGSNHLTKLTLCPACYECAW